MSAPVWRSAEPAGFIPALGLVGTGPVAILTGFTLAAVITLAESAHKGAWHGAALILFSGSVVLLVFTLRYIISAQLHQASPQDRLAWHPEAAISAEVLESQRIAQYTDLWMYVWYRKRALWTFPFGVAFALLGLAAVIIGDRGGHQRWFALSSAVILAISAVVAGLEIIDQPQDLFPTTAGLRPLADKGFLRALAKNPDAQHPFLPGPLSPTGLASILRNDFSSERWLQPGVRTHEELVRLAASHGAREIYEDVASLLFAQFDGHFTTEASLIITTTVDDRSFPIFSLHPASSSSQLGLAFTASIPAIALLLNVSASAAVALLPGPHIVGEEDGLTGQPGYITRASDLAPLIERIRGRRNV